MARDQRREAPPPAVVESAEQLPDIVRSRDITPELWSAITGSIWPGARTESQIMAWDYCRARGLDPLQKPVHIVSMWVDGGMRDVILPGINTYRVQAVRTKTYAGHTPVEWGPAITRTWHRPGSGNRPARDVEVTFPEWARLVIFRIVEGHKVEFPVEVRWLEAYQTAGRSTDCPNDMWAKRPYGQLAKCAEADGLRRAFPDAVEASPTYDEIGAGPAPEAPESPPEGAPRSRGSRTEQMLDELQRRQQEAPATDPAPQEGPGTVLEGEVVQRSEPSPEEREQRRAANKARFEEAVAALRRAESEEELRQELEQRLPQFGQRLRPRLVTVADELVAAFRVEAEAMERIRAIGSLDELGSLTAELLDGAGDPGWPEVVRSRINEALDAAFRRIETEAAEQADDLKGDTQ